MRVLLDTNVARGHLVVYEKNQNSFNRTKTKLLKSLSQIPQKRLKFFFVKSANSNIEYWIVTKKKRD